MCLYFLIFFPWLPKYGSSLPSFLNLFPCLYFHSYLPFPRYQSTFILYFHFFNRFPHVFTLTHFLSLVAKTLFFNTLAEFFFICLHPHWYLPFSVTLNRMCVPDVLELLHREPSVQRKCEEGGDLRPRRLAVGGLRRVHRHAWWSQELTGRLQQPQQPHTVRYWPFW